MNPASLKPVTITKVELKRITDAEGEKVKLKAVINGEKWKIAYRLGEISFDKSLYQLAQAMEMICRWREVFPDMPRQKLGVFVPDLPEYLYYPRADDWNFIRRDFRSIQNFI